MNMSGKKISAIEAVLMTNSDICDLYEKRGVLREDLREVFYLAEKGIQNVEELEWSAYNYDLLWKVFIEEASKGFFTEDELKEGKVIANLFGAVEMYKKFFDKAAAHSMDHHIPPALYCSVCNKMLRRERDCVHPCSKCHSEVS